MESHGKSKKGWPCTVPSNSHHYGWSNNNLRLANHQLRLFVVETGLNLIFIQYIILVGIHFFP